MIVRRGGRVVPSDSSQHEKLIFPGIGTAAGFVDFGMLRGRYIHFALFARRGRLMMMMMLLVGMGMTAKLGVDTCTGSVVMRCG